MSYTGKDCKTWRVGLGLLAVIVLQMTLAFAQLPVGTISGVVQDKDGGVIPGATITATHRETGQIRKTETSGNGRFSLPAMPVGPWDVKAEAPSFSPEIKQGVALAVTQEINVSFTLNVGSVQQTVEVAAEAPIVETTSGSLGGLVNEQRVSELPLNGRNFNSLVLLQTGISVHKQTSSTSSTGVGLVFSSNGAPIRSNLMLLDGANLASAEGITGVSITGAMLGVEGIREYRVITNSFPAEYGLAMGSQTTIVSKGGTNQYHGSLFEFLRNSNLDARNFFDKKAHPTDPRIPAFRRNDFGGSIGGPIKKDKTFFFATYEGTRESLGITQTLATPTAAARVDNFFPNTPVAESIKPFLALYPLPTEPLPGDPTGRQGVGQYIYVFKQPTREDFGQARVDHNFNESDSFFARHTIADTGRTDPAERWPGFPRLGSSRGNFLTIAENHTFLPTLLNMFRASFSRTFQRFDSPTLTDPKYEFLAGQGFGSVAPGSGITALGPSTPWIVFNQNLYTMSNDLFWSHGSHSVKFGMLLNRYQVFTEPTTSRRGTYTFSNLQSFLQANPRQFQAITPGSVTYRHYRWLTIGGYVQDDWRATPRLTLNIGVRYEINTAVNEHSGHGSYIKDIRNDAQFVVAPQLFSNPSKKNFGPRVGFGWDVFGNSTMAIRGGFGVLYDISNMAGATQVSATATPPFSARSTVLTAIGFPKPVIPASAQGKGIRVVDYNLGQPHMLHYNLTIEKQLPGSMSLSTAYVGTRGINLYQSKEGNPTVPQILADGTKFWTGNDLRVNSNWEDAEFKTAGGDSFYNALQVSLQRRLTSGLQLQSSYTWSKAVDTTQGQKGGESGGSSNVGTDPSNPSLDRGPSDFDTRHSWTVNMIYTIPNIDAGRMNKLVNGWRLGSIFSMPTGLPFTVSLSGNRSRSKVLASSADRPNMVAGRNASNIILGDPNKYFDPLAFTIQPVGTLGNASRNYLNGPRQVNLDFSLAKDIPLNRLGENTRLEFRGEFFNVLNHANFSIPVEGRTIYTADPNNANTTPLSSAGQITRTRGDARQVQFALKLTF